MSLIKYSAKDSIVLDGVFSAAAFSLASQWLTALRRSFLARVAGGYFKVTLSRSGEVGDSVSVKIQIVVDPLLITLRTELAQSASDAKASKDANVLLTIHRIEWNQEGKFHTFGEAIDFCVVCGWERWTSGLAALLHKSSRKLRGVQDLAPARISAVNRLLSYAGDGDFDSLDISVEAPKEFGCSFKPDTKFVFQGPDSVDVASLELVAGWLLALEGAFFSESSLSREICVKACSPAVVDVSIVFTGNLMAAVLWREASTSSVQLVPTPEPSLVIAQDTFVGVREWESTLAKLMVANVSPKFAQPLQAILSVLDHIELQARRFVSR